MNDVQMLTNEQFRQQTMSSLEIANLTGKPHNDVMKAICAMEVGWEKVSQGKFSLSSRKVQQPNEELKKRDIIPMLERC